LIFSDFQRNYALGGLFSKAVAVFDGLFVFRPNHEGVANDQGSLYHVHFNVGLPSPLIFTNQKGA